MKKIVGGYKTKHQERQSCRNFVDLFKILRDFFMNTVCTVRGISQGLSKKETPLLHNCCPPWLLNNLSVFETLRYFAIYFNAIFVYFSITVEIAGRYFVRSVQTTRCLILPLPNQSVCATSVMNCYYSDTQLAATSAII